MNTGSDTSTTKCHRCGRTLRSASSVAAGYGRWCRARIRAAIIAGAVKGFAERQVEKARELIADGGIVAVRRQVFRAVSSDGERTYLTSPQTCLCTSGLRRLTATTCFHSLAALILVTAKGA